MKKVIISVFAVFALVGCAKEMPHGQNGSNEVKVERGPLVQMQAIISDSDSQTRVSVDEQTGKLSWSEGDQVAVVLSDGTSYSLDKNKYIIDHKTGILEIPNNSAYVIYPASQATELDGTKLTLALPFTHNVATPADAFDNALMKGVVNASENRVEFKNLLGFFEVPLTGEGKLKSAVLRTICRTTSDFHPVSNSATLDLSKDATTADGAIKMATDNAAYAWVRYNFSDNVALSSNPSVYFAVPAGEYENMGIVLVTDRGSNAIYAANAHKVDRSTVKPVSASAIDLSSHTPASPVSLVGTGATSKEKYANCYMVPPVAGSYEFDCILADGTDLKDKGGVTAEIKWAEQAGMINDLCYDPVSNKISFKTNGKEGNALVVLTRNSEKNIVWTWHIWITDTPKVLNINGGKSSTDDRTSNQYYLMDRVLGATWAPSSILTTDASQTYDSKKVPMCKTLSSSDATDACGVYFQYQNRIPLPRIKNIDATTQEAIALMDNTKCDVMYGFSQYGQYWSTSSGSGTIWQDSDTGQYIFNNFNYHNYEYTISGSDNTLWMANVLNGSSEKDQSAPVTGGYRFWSSNTSREHDSMLASKTSHDPCPPGYVIETSSCQYSYVDLRKTEVSFARAAQDNSECVGGYKFYGMYFNLAKDEQGNTLALYFPCASQRTGCKVTRLSGTYGNMGYIYAMNTASSASSTYSVATTTTGQGACIQYGASASGKAIGWPVWNAAKKQNAQAYNVRCRRGEF